MTKKKKLIRVDETNLWLATIDVDEFDIDASTEEGREQLGAIAAHAHWRHPTLTHFLFCRGDEQIGEMIIAPAKKQMS